ncbi:phage terminase large subunit [Aquimarina sp. 2-A2]|uniref:phage terminase large subunit n=1 Tax=Aquimarina sp. 2-A2 TaxID=3382644 RepID=UPI00387F0CD9
MISSPELKNNSSDTSSYGLTPVFLMNWWAVNQKNEDGTRKYKYIINTGSSRSSKTWSLIECMHRLCEANEGWRVTAWRETKKSCKDTVWKDFQKVLRISDRLDVRRRNKTESYYAYDNNSTFEIHGTDDEESVHGLTQNVAWLNEPYKTSKETFDQIDMRADLVFMDWNPKKNSFIDDVSKQDNAIVIPSTYKDNPFCPLPQKIKIESHQPVHMSVIHDYIGEDAYKYDCNENKNGYTEEEITELKRCQKNEAQKTANEYKWQVYGLGLKAEKPNKIYTGWETMSLAEFIALPYDSFYGMDFGQANPSAIAEVKYHDGVFYVNQLLYKPEREMKEGLIHEMNRIGLDKSAPLICDPGGQGGDLKILELRRAGYNAKPASKPAGSVFAGISFLQRARVVYTTTSPDIEAEYDLYEWDMDRLGVVDKPIKADDHILDAIRYVVMYMQIKLRITF